VFVEASERQRVDVFDLRSSKHIRGWRPADDQESPFQRAIVWASFLNEDQVVTLNQGGDLVLWAIDSCRAVYVLPLGPGVKTFLNKSRSHLFAASASGPGVLVETATGKCCGRLRMSDGQPSAISAAAFRADGRTIALLKFLGDERQLLVWDAQRDTVVTDMVLPSKSFFLSWSGKSHVVLRSTPESTDRNRSSWQFTVVDVAASRVVWNYQVPITGLSTEGPDDQFWCLVPGGLRSPTQLVAMPLPDQDAERVISATPPPRPLFGPGTRLTLKVTIGGMPDELPDRRIREERFERDLRDHFQRELTAAGIKVMNAAPVALDVTVRELTRDDLSAIRSRPRFRDRELPTGTKSLRAYVAIRQDDLVLWDQLHLIGADDVKVGRPPKNLSPKTFTLLTQWDAAKIRCQSTALPKQLYHPDSYLGVGESELSASGARFLRKYAAAE
jgi:hypothetical protein